MSEPFLGQIQPFPYNFAPRGWAFCDGQILSIAQNTALFALLGTTYGGNGTTTFALPDLRGRTALHAGQGPGLDAYILGQVGGVERVTLIASQMPAHNHALNANTGEPEDSIPTGQSLASGPIYRPAAPNTAMNTGSIGMAGSNQPHENRQPFLVISWCIALDGIFPSRN